MLVAPAASALKPMSEALQRSPDNLLGLVIMVDMEVEGAQLSVPYEIISWNSFSCKYCARPCRDKDCELYGELLFEDIVVSAFDAESYDAVYVNEGDAWEGGEAMVAGGEFAGALIDDRGAAVERNTKVGRVSKPVLPVAVVVAEVASTEESAQAAPEEEPRPTEEQASAEVAEAQPECSAEAEAALQASDAALAEEARRTEDRLECAAVLELLVAAVAHPPSVTPRVVLVALGSAEADSAELQPCAAPSVDSHDAGPVQYVVSAATQSLAKFDAPPAEALADEVAERTELGSRECGHAQGAVSAAQSDDGVDVIVLPEVQSGARRRQSGSHMFVISEEELERVALLEGEAARARIEAEAEALARARAAAEEEERVREELAQERRLMELEEEQRVRMAQEQETASEDYFADESAPIAERTDASDAPLDEEPDEAVRSLLDSEQAHFSHIYDGLHLRHEGLASDLVAADGKRASIGGSCLDGKRDSHKNEEQHAVKLIVDAQTSHSPMTRGTSVMNQSRDHELAKIQEVLSLQREGAGSGQGERKPAGALPELKVAALPELRVAQKRPVIDMALTTRNELARATSRDQPRKQPDAETCLDSKVALLDSFLDMESSTPLSWDHFASMVDSSVNAAPTGGKLSSAMEDNRRMKSMLTAASRLTAGSTNEASASTLDEETLLRLHKKLAPTVSNMVCGIACRCLVLTLFM